MHIDFHEQQVPDTTTLLKVRHMLEANKLGEKIFADVRDRLDKAGLMIHGETIVDARQALSNQRHPAYAFYCR